MRLLVSTVPRSVMSQQHGPEIDSEFGLNRDHGRQEQSDTNQRYDTQRIGPLAPVEVQMITARFIPRPVYKVIEVERFD